MAWLRTAIALIGFGFAIARFGLFLRELQTAVTGRDVSSHSLVSSQVIGVALVIIGIVLIALAAWNYNRVLRQIERGSYQPNPLLVWITAAIVMIVGTLSLPLLLWRQPSPPSSLSPRACFPSPKFGVRVKHFGDKSWIKSKFLVQMLRPYKSWKYKHPRKFS